ncbi:MAG: hypothetical protein H3C27_15310 [Opitutaceae bacterium]|nr:hypothetical protein [Opitutaceae bacterium]
MRLLVTDAAAQPPRQATAWLIMTLGKESVSTAAQIKARREELGLDLKKVAADLSMNEPSYWDIESYDDELSEVAEFAQAIQLARLLRVRLLALLEEDFDYAQACKISFQDLRELIEKRVAAGEISKDGLSWDIDEFLEEPKIAFEYPIAFLKLLAPEVGFDWRQVVANYEEA